MPYIQIYWNLSEPTIFFAYGEKSPVKPPSIGTYDFFRRRRKKPSKTSLK